MKTHPFKTVLYIVLLLLFSSERHAYAYLDPGSGSYLLQILMAGLLAASLTIKMFWRNIKDFISRLLHKRKKQ